jgi:phage host-nuclease inhibitor protein Gam
LHQKAIKKLTESKQKTKEINSLEKIYKSKLDLLNHKNEVLEKQYKNDINILKNDIKNLKSQVQNLVEIMESIMKIKN